MIAFNLICTYYNLGVPVIITQIFVVDIEGKGNISVVLVSVFPVSYYCCVIHFFISEVYFHHKVLCLIPCLSLYGIHWDSSFEPSDSFLVMSDKIGVLYQYIIHMMTSHNFLFVKFKLAQP